MTRRPHHSPIPHHWWGTCETNIDAETLKCNQVKFCFQFVKALHWNQSIFFIFCFVLLFFCLNFYFSVGGNIHCSQNTSHGPQDLLSSISPFPRVAACSRFSPIFSPFILLRFFFQAWKSEGIKIEGSLVMYKGIESCQKCRNNPAVSQRNHGARYLVPFSPECPHFEVWHWNVNSECCWC